MSNKKKGRPNEGSPKQNDPVDSTRRTLLGNLRRLSLCVLIAEGRAAA
jgi:hypothetical protein